MIAQPFDLPEQSTKFPWCDLCPGFFFLLRVDLFIFREGKEERKRGRETPMCERNVDCLPLSDPSWGPGPKPRHVP